MKNSLKGLICVEMDKDGKFFATDCVSKEEETYGCLEVVFEDGKLVKEYSLAEIRERLASYV